MRKTVYVAHAFQNKQENKEDVEQIILDLIEEYPDYVFYSPIHATGFYYDKKPWLEGMMDCLELLSRCDELWLCKNFEQSKGCCVELGFAIGRNMPIEYIVDEVV